MTYDDARKYEVRDSLVRDEQEATRPDGATKRASRRKSASSDEERRSYDGRNSTEPEIQPRRPRRLKSPGGRKVECMNRVSGCSKGGRIITYARQMTQQRGSIPLMQQPCRAEARKKDGEQHQLHQQDAATRRKDVEHMRRSREMPGERCTYCHDAETRHHAC